jgi:flagellar motility protein MotE (MotC chaperone)
MKSYRNIRVIPVVVTAIFCLAVLKIAGLVLDGGYVFAYDPTAGKPSWAQEMLNFPVGPPKADATDITGSVEGKKDAAPEAKEGAKDAAPKPSAPETKPDGMVLHPEEAAAPVSPSERAILERLQSRRQELEARAREIDIRESLLKEAEKRIENKVGEMKAVEAKNAAATDQKSEANNARFKGIVTMYENMKPKDAAKVFNGLEMPVLIEIAAQINPRKMSDIMGLMATDAAERLTVELARRASGDQSAAAAAELPKIEGKILPQK